MTVQISNVAESLLSNARFNWLVAGGGGGGYC